LDKTAAGASRPAAALLIRRIKENVRTATTPAPFVNAMARLPCGAFLSNYINCLAPRRSLFGARLKSRIQLASIYNINPFCSRQASLSWRRRRPCDGCFVYVLVLG
jgi:hypothetical protein